MLHRYPSLSRVSFVLSREPFLVSLRLAALAPPLVDLAEDSFDRCGRSHTLDSYKTRIATPLGRDQLSPFDP
jgi:hypothetical protein